MIKIALADDHPMVVEGIKEFLEKQDDLLVVHACHNGEEMLEALREQSVDVVIMDINMPKRDGISCTRLIKARYPKTKVIILTMYNENTYVKSIIEAGADGCVLKTKGREELMRAIQQVYNDQKHFSEQTDHPDINKKFNISERELEIIRLLVQGYKAREISDLIHISELTVRTHQKNIYRKLQITNITDLAAFALNNNLLK